MKQYVLGLVSFPDPNNPSILQAILAEDVWVWEQDYAGLGLMEWDG